MSFEHTNPESWQPLYSTDMERLYNLIYDFYNAYKLGDVPTIKRTFHIIKSIARMKQELPTFEDFLKIFSVSRPSRFRNRAYITLCAEYVAYLHERISEMSQGGLQPEPFS